MRVAVFAAFVFGFPQVKLVPGVDTVGWPDKPAARGCVELVISNWVCVWVVVPKSVPETGPVIPISSRTSNSQLITGTATYRNLLRTLPAFTVEETITTAFPSASVATRLLFATLTVTVNPR